MADDRRGRPLENRAFALLIAAITVVLALTIWPFAGPVLWAVVLSIVFLPLYDRLNTRMPGHPSRAAVLTLLVIAIGIVAPVILLASAVINEAAGVYTRVRSGQVDLNALFFRAEAWMPRWARDMLQGAGVADLESLRAKLTHSIQAQAQNIAARALDIGSSLAALLLGLAIMLYLAFYLLRDGRRLTTIAGESIPLQAHRRAILAEQFVTVVRATVKGSVVVAIAQGTLGGIIMSALGVPEALLWAVVMAFSALLPAIGTGLVWVPASLYLLATGATWQGIVMALAGLLVIGSLDNILRPILVGRETKMPDALVLLTTLGGLTTFGFNGLIIGPIAAAMFLAAWNMVREERGEQLPDSDVAD